MKAHVSLFSPSAAYAAVVGILIVFPVLGQTQPEILRPNPRAGFLKHLTVESFGYTASASQLGYEFKPSTTSSYFNLHHLDCPLCIPGPPPFSRTRPVLAPFGAKAKVNFWNERLFVFASYSGIDHINGDNTPRLDPNSWRATSNNDDWFVTSEAGSQIYLTTNKTISLGFTKGEIQDYGPGRTRWSKTTGAVSLSPDVVKQLGRFFKRNGQQ